MFSLERVIKNLHNQVFIVKNAVSMISFSTGLLFVYRRATEFYEVNLKLFISYKRSMLEFL